MTALQRILAIALFSQLALGCVSFNSVEPESPVTGLKQILDRGRPVSMLFVHGMGVHEKNWSDDLQKGFAEGLGFTMPDNPIVDHDIERNRVIVGHVVIRLATNDDYPFPIRYVELTWSPMTTDAKLTLLDLEDVTYKERNVLQDRRVLVNSMAKVFVNEKLSDVALYAGQLKVTINDIVAEAICALSAQHVSILEERLCFAPGTKCYIR